MKTAIKKKLIAALKSGDYLLNLKDKHAPLCEILPNGDHRFSPAGVLCDLAPKEVADWVFIRHGLRVIDKSGCDWYAYTSFAVDEWAGVDWYSPPINGHRTLSATIAAIEEL